jgi:hypothetical protein
MCTVHIFCGREFWVKVVCHKLGFILGSLLWKKSRRGGLSKTPTPVEVPAELKEQKVVSPRQIGIDPVNGVGGEL